MNRPVKSNGKSTTTTRRPYIGDVGTAPASRRHKVDAGLGMVLFSLAVGFVVGLTVWAVFWASSALTELLWEEGRNSLTCALKRMDLPSWWVPIAFCTMGGLVIGLWTSRFGGAPRSLEHVMGTVKKTGGYRLERPGASIVGFLLPLVFGGSVGPEAGLTGIIADACTRIGRGLKAVGLHVRGIADVTVSAALSAVFATPLVGIVATAQDAMPRQSADPDAYDLRRRAKLVLYTAAALGAMAGIAVFTWAFGTTGGIPRFDGITPHANKLWWAVPCLLVGYAGAILYRCADAAFRKLNPLCGDHPVAKPTVAGAVLGLLAIPLPYVLFPGEEQAAALMYEWSQMGGLVLLATGLLKCIATPLCLNFGWGGGHFFPCIFSGIAAGYGIASLAGIDPMFCIAITTATLVAGVQRKPLVALALLLLCFPVDNLIWMGTACLVGSALPMPAKLLNAQEE